MKRKDSEFNSAAIPAEELRLRYQYRRLLLRSRTRLPRRTLIGLLGPDCAYHLYRWEEYRGQNEQE